MVFTQNALGNWSSKVYAISLLASGQSSTVTGTYAGQFIMQVIQLGMSQGDGDTLGRKTPVPRGFLVTGSHKNFET